MTIIGAMAPTTNDTHQLSFADALAPAAPTGPTLAQAREDTMRAAAGAGVRCPCCGQHVKCQPRLLNSIMARILIALYRADNGTGNYSHLQTVADYAANHHGGDGAKLRYWRLIETDSRARGDGGKAGFWKITPEGRAFVRGLSTVPKYAVVFDGACLELDGPPIGIRDALGSDFDYDDLMSTTANAVRRGAA